MPDSKSDFQASPFVKVIAFLESGSFLKSLIGLEFASEKCQNMFKSEGNISSFCFFRGLKTVQGPGFSAANVSIPRKAIRARAGVS